VQDQFLDRPQGTIERLVSDWAPRMGVDVPELGPHCEIWLEHWNHLQIANVLHKAAAVDPKMIVSKRPRRQDMPMTAFHMSGLFGLIDGRHRANLWHKQAGWYPILIIETDDYTTNPNGRKA
jgi:hypothetical protein